MTDEEQRVIKEIAIEKRRKGETLDGCAILAGIDEVTLYRWKKDDATFATRLRQAWREWRGYLIEETIKKSPDKILAAQFKKEFGQEDKDKPQQINNFFIGESNLADTLTRYLQEHVERPSPAVLGQSNPTTETRD